MRHIRAIISRTTQSHLGKKKENWCSPGHSGWQIHLLLNVPRRCYDRVHVGTIFSSITGQKVCIYSWIRGNLTKLTSQLNWRRTPLNFTSGHVTSTRVEACFRLCCNAMLKKMAKLNGAHLSSDQKYLQLISVRPRNSHQNNYER